MEYPSPSEPVTLEEARILFAQLAGRDDILFRFPEDGCYARAHLMVQHLLQRGVVPGKVWTFAQGLHDLLWVNPLGRSASIVRWHYHVAPTIQVRGSADQVSVMVLDPALFDQPVGIEQWRDVQHDTPRMILTALGQPPLPQRGGSGYWPGADPLEGPDIHAGKTMEQYRRRLTERDDI